MLPHAKTEWGAAANAYFLYVNMFTIGIGIEVKISV